MNIIEVMNLIFRYKRYAQAGEEPEQITVLNNISLDIKAGDFVGILGHNGSGKSTLARHLTALLKPTDGVVYVKGMDTSSGDTLAIRKTAGIVFQNPDNQLIGNTVEEDVAFGLENLGTPREEMIKRITEALDLTGMTAYKMSTPGSLSGGQKQRVAISGILAMQPECIVFDEPTAMLDPAGREDVMNAVRFLNRERGITVIYITHHIEEVEDADCLYILKQGRVEMGGLPSKIWNRADAMEICGIEMPFIHQLIRQLERRKVISPGVIHSEFQLLDQLERQFSEVVSEGRRHHHGPVENPADSVGTLNPCLHLDHVSYRYPGYGDADRKNALSDITLSVVRGEYISILGQTGCGKSTLLQVMNGLLKPDEGICSFDGKDIHTKDYSMKLHRRKVALCFQYPEQQLFEETVLKDIAFGPSNMGFDEESCLEKARKAMKLVGLTDDLEQVSPFSLSGGQKRRVALAGILAMEPEFLILDEPAAGLDKEGRERLFALLKKLNEDDHVTIIMVSHDMNEAAAHSSRIIVMKEGRIMADGIPGEIFLNEELLLSAGLARPDSVRFLSALNERLGGRLSLQRDWLPYNVRDLAEWIEEELGGENGTSSLEVTGGTMT